VIPYNDSGGQPDLVFLTNLRNFLSKRIAKGEKFVIVIGGGRTCRNYQQAAREAGNCSADQLDWLGIEATKLNAALLSCVFHNNAYKKIISHKPNRRQINLFLKSGMEILISSGWAPGWSTDYDAIVLAALFGQKQVVVVSDIAFVCDKDPRKFSDAKPLKDLLWSEFENYVPSVWTPGLSSPLDPKATQLAKKNKITVKMVKGSDWDSFDAALDGKDFIGTTIHS